MRPIPAPRIGDSHGLLRAIEQRGRLRTDEFVTEFSLEQLFPPDLENALGRMRHFISYARSAGLVKEDRGVVELTEVGKRYVRAGDASAPFDVSALQAEWLRRQLREKHMTDSIFHGMAIGLSLLASIPPGTRVSTLDFGRSLAYLGRAGWDNENTFQIQGERYLALLTDVELLDGEHRLTETGEQVRGELTLPVHMSLLDIAAQLNPGGAEGVRVDAAAEWSVAPPAPATATGEYQDVGPGTWAPPPEPSSENGEGALPSTPPAAGPPVPPADIWETSGPEDATKAIPAARPPVVPRAAEPATTAGDPLAPAEDAAASAGEPVAESPAAAPGGEVVAESPAAAPGGEVVAESPAAAPGGEVVAESPAVAPGGEVVAESPAVAPGGEVVAESPAAAPADEAFAGDDALGGAVTEVARPAAPDVAALGGVAAGAAIEGAPAAGDVPVTGDAVEDVPVARDVAALGGVAAGAALHGAPAAGDVVPRGDDAAAGGPAEIAERGDESEVAARPAGDVASLGAAAAEAARAHPPSPGDVTALGDAAAEAARAGGLAAGASPADVAAARAAAPAAADVAALGGAVADVAAAAAPAASIPSGGGLRSEPGAFLDPVAIRAAGEAGGLRLPDAIYASIAAALGAGKHVLLTGAPGAGKTSLALAVARAAAQAGRANGATLVTARHRWAEQAMLVESAKQGRWVIVDELDRARLDRALGELSTFLAGLPVVLAGGEEAEPAAGWRIVATAARVPHASAALLRRFAVLDVPQPAGQALVESLHAAAGGDETAAAAIGRLLPLAQLAPLGAGVFLDAARHAAARNAAVQADEATLAREAYTAYVAPLLGDLDDDAEQRVRELLGDG